MSVEYSNVLKKWTLARNQNANYIDRLFKDMETLEAEWDEAILEKGFK